MLSFCATAVDSLREAVGVAEGVPMWQTLLAAMQVLPQGMPLRQFFWASVLLTANRLRPRTVNSAYRTGHLQGEGAVGSMRDRGLAGLGGFAALTGGVFDRGGGAGAWGECFSFTAPLE